MHITAQGPRLRNDLYCVEWDAKLYYTYTLLISPGTDTDKGATTCPRYRNYLLFTSIEAVIYSVT